MDHAFELARTRRGYVTSATKSNGIVHTMPFWDEVVRERAAEFPDVRWDQELIDALAAKVVLEPGRFDVIVASNLFGDILSDLTAAVAGSIGIAPSANLDPTRAGPSMFEPVHGSAPDIAGQGVANPIGTVWSAVMMLDHLGHAEAAAQLMDARPPQPQGPRHTHARPRRHRWHRRGRRVARVVRRPTRPRRAPSPGRPRARRRLLAVEHRGLVERVVAGQHPVEPVAVEAAGPVPISTVATELPAKFVTRPGLGHEPVDADDQADAVDQLGAVRAQAAGEGRHAGAGDAGGALRGDHHEQQQRDLLADASAGRPAPRR